MGTLRSDAPLTVSDMKSSYLPDEAISATGERLLRTCLDGLRQIQYGVLYTPFLGLTPHLASTAGDEAVYRHRARVQVRRLLFAGGRRMG
jgi:hypothetical protein